MGCGECDVLGYNAYGGPNETKRLLITFETKTFDPKYILTASATG